MRFLLLFLSSFLFFNDLLAQSIKGRIVDDNTAEPLADVVVQNLNHIDFHAFSDKDGHYEIDIRRGDSVKFSLVGFSPRILVFNGNNEGWFSWVGMRVQNFMIDTIVVHKELTQYQKDSIERRKLYGKAVDYKPAKPQLPKFKDLKAGKPYVIKAPISGFIEKHQKRYKKLKAFQEQYHEEEIRLFIDSRYNQQLVAGLTNLKDDSLLLFMHAYPMSYSFARAASDLEIKMWIKYNYREWMKLQDEKKP